MKGRAPITRAPIALFAYNRPEHLRRTVEKLVSDPLASTSDLFIFCDGPKTQEHEIQVQAVRSFAKTIVGFHTLTVVERASNYGLARSISVGVTDLCRKYGRVIVLEDDLLVTPGFIQYMNEGLDRYKDNPNIYQLSGYMYPVELTSDDDCIFLPMISCWGWATWERAWRCFDPSLNGIEHIRASKPLRQKFNVNGTYDYFKMAEDQLTGKIDSWGICWYLSVFMREGLVLYPKSSFIQNIGVDATGTHGKGHKELQPPLSVEFKDVSAFKFPKTASIDMGALVSVQNLFTKMGGGVFSQLMRWLLK